MRTRSLMITAAAACALSLPAAAQQGTATTADRSATRDIPADTGASPAASPAAGRSAQAIAESREVRTEEGREPRSSGGGEIRTGEGATNRSGVADPGLRGQQKDEPGEDRVTAEDMDVELDPEVSAGQDRPAAGQRPSGSAVGQDTEVDREGTPGYTAPTRQAPVSDTMPTIDDRKDEAREQRATGRPD